MRVYVVKEGILGTPLYLIAVVKKGKISPLGDNVFNR